MTLSITEGQRRFAEWRAQKRTLREPIPEELWKRGSNGVKLESLEI